MFIRSSIAEMVGRSSYWFLHSFSMVAVPYRGQLTLLIDPHILKAFSKQYDVSSLPGLTVRPSPLH